MADYEKIDQAFTNLEGVLKELNKNENQSTQISKALITEFDQAVDGISSETKEIFKVDASSTLIELIEDFRNAFKKDLDTSTESLESAKKCADLGGKVLAIDFVRDLVKAYYDEIVQRTAKASNDTAIEGAKVAENLAVRTYNNLVNLIEQENLISFGDQNDYVANLLNYIQ